MNDLEQRLGAAESRIEGAFAIDARLKSIEANVGKLKSSSVRDWIQTLGPYVSGVVLLLLAYWVKDSVQLALQREELDLKYAKEMRDLVKDFDEATEQGPANANAVGLAMYGKYAIIPLVERLEGGDVANVAAEKGLRLVGSNDPAVACPMFKAILVDPGQRFRWQTHKTMIKVIGQSACLNLIPTLQRYEHQLTTAGATPQALTKFANRYAQPEDFDAAGAEGLHTQLRSALAILNAQVQP